MVCLAMAPQLAVILVMFTLAAIGIALVIWKAW
jgi:hypothetical protein